jgi:hypothetical protein
MLDVDRADDTSPTDEDETPAGRNQQSIKLPRKLAKRVRLAAVFLDRTVSDIHEEAVTRYLDQLQAERREQGLPPVPEPPD